MKEIYTSCYSLIKHVIYIPCFRGQPAVLQKLFSNITFIEVKTKYRSPYVLYVF